MKIDQIRLSRHFIRDDGTEETIELTASTKFLHAAAVKDAVTQLRIELEQFDETGMIVDDVRSQTESAKSELSAVLRRLDGALDDLVRVRNLLKDEGKQVNDLYHAIETAEQTLAQE